jgi:hypothetical protein
MKLLCCEISYCVDDAVIANFLAQSSSGGRPKLGSMTKQSAAIALANIARMTWAMMARANAAIEIRTSQKH